MIKSHEIKLLNKALSKFLWKDKKPRIALPKLWMPRGEGGLNIPNIKMYNIACLLRHALDWLTHSSRYSNWEVEHAWPPHGIQWLCSIFPLINVRTCCVIMSSLKDTITAWRDVRNKLHLPYTLSLLTPMVGNPNFPQGIHHRSYTTWLQKGLRYFHQLFHSSPWRTKTFQELQMEFTLPNNHLFYYWQATSCWKQLYLPPAQIFSASFLDVVVSSEKYSFSVLYPNLQLLYATILSTPQGSPWQKYFSDLKDVDELLSRYNRLSKITVSET